MYARVLREAEDRRQLDWLSQTANRKPSRRSICPGPSAPGDFLRRRSLSCHLTGIRVPSRINWLRKALGSWVRLQESIARRCSGAS
jgi:hypothetical protein